MRALKLTLAYDGTAYAGWQVQLTGPTIQGALEQTLAQITGQHVRVTASGRTDAGVHALGQVVSLQTESTLSTEVLRRALNAELPHDVVVLNVKEAPLDFHAIRDAQRKRYRYQIHNHSIPALFDRSYVWQIPTPVDVHAMHRAGQSLVGKHDFRSFQSAGGERNSTVRNVYELLVRRETDANSNRVAVEIEADGFLYNMVRTIVGTLVEVGRGARPEDWPRDVMLATDRKQAGPTAPPQGLFLMKVVYEPFAPS